MTGGRSAGVKIAEVRAGLDELRIGSQRVVFFARGGESTEPQTGARA
jgi:hypothetical protein